MSDFTDELSRSLAQLTQEASDWELLQAFDKADYAFYRGLNDSIVGLLDEGFLQHVTVASAALNLPATATGRVVWTKNRLRSVSLPVFKESEEIEEGLLLAA